MIRRQSRNTVFDEKRKMPQKNMQLAIVRDEREFTLTDQSDPGQRR